MKISNRQKRAIEKITGKYWHLFNEGIIKEYFAYTDKGVKPENELNELIIAHRQHPLSIEWWKNDFRCGLLFLWDFLNPEDNYPESYIDHAFNIYESVFNYIPTCYRECLASIKGGANCG